MASFDLSRDALDSAYKEVLQDVCDAVSGFSSVPATFAFRLLRFKATIEGFRYSSDNGLYPRERVQSGARVLQTATDDSLHLHEGESFCESYFHQHHCHFTVVHVPADARVGVYSLVGHLPS